MENILNLLNKYQSLILIGLGVLILIVVLIRTRKRKVISIQDTISNVTMHPEIKKHSNHSSKKTSITIDGESFQDINKIKDPATREKVRKAIEFAKQSGFSEDDKSDY